MSSIIILSGPVGAGKTTIAKELVANATGPAVNIEGDKFWLFIAKGSEEIGRNKNFKTVMVSMLASSFSFARAGYEVIIDFSVPPWFLDTARDIVTARGFTLDYIIVRPQIEICAQRAAQRSVGKVTNYKEYEAFYEFFNTMEAHTIPNDETDAATVAGWIRNGLKEGAFRAK